MNHKGMLIADLHIGSINSMKQYDEIKNRIYPVIKSEHPDFIIFLGDYFDHKFSLNDEPTYYSVLIINEIIAICKENGMEVDEYFCDNGVSGLKFEREALQRMLSVLQDGDIVIAKDIARISREISQCMSIVGSIYKAGALIKFLN